MIAISYRREDSSPAAGRLYDRLQAEFGKGNVFMDFDSIPYGVDFRDKIKQTLEGAQVVIAVIGPNWLGSRGRGKRRINDPTDFVRIEIAQALLRGIPVIPVLLDNTAMPNVESLPEELRGLAYRNALMLDTGVDFHHHTNRLIAGIRDLVVLPPSLQSQLKSSQLEDLPRKVTTSSAPASKAEADSDRQQRTKLILLGAVVLLALVTTLALWILISSLTKSNNHGGIWGATTQATPSSAPTVVSPPPSLITTFRADTPAPILTPTPTATATPTPTAPAPIATPAPTIATSFNSTPFPTVALTPTWTPPLEVITEQESQVMVHSFYGAVERKDIDYLLSLFADSVDYHTDGYQGKAAIRDDYTRYFKRWPVASFTIGDVRIRHSTAPNNVVLVFEIRFAVKDPASKRNKTGQAEEEWVLERIRGVPRITSQRETVHSDPIQQRSNRR